MRKTISMILAAVFVFAAFGALASDAPPAFATFGEAEEAARAADEEPAIGGSSEYMTAVVEYNGKYYRAVAELDERAKELDEAISEAGVDGIDAAFQAFYDYVATLPVTYIEEFTAVPKTQAELDALTGKTIAELEEQGYINTSSGTADEDLIAFWMSDGLYEYEFIVDADFNLYEQKQEQDELGTLTVRSGRLSGASMLATDLRYRADGTVEPEEDPFEGVEWLGEITAAFEAAQNGEEVDLEALLESLKEAYPESAEMIDQIMQSYKIIYQDGANDMILE